MDILSGCRLRLQNNLTEQVLPGYGLIFRQGERARKKDAQFPKRPIRDWQAGLSTPPGEDVPATARTSRVVLRRSPFCSQCGRRCVHTLSLAGHIVKPRPQEKGRPVTQTARNLGGASHESPVVPAFNLSCRTYPVKPPRATEGHVYRPACVGHVVPVPRLYGLVASSGR